jgi:hypothetical protein
MVLAPLKPTELDPRTRGFYRRALAMLNSAGLPFLVGGAYALERYTGIERHTKDFDLFVRREHYDDVARVLASAGCATELTFPHWLGKARCGADFVDLIFSSGNGLARVDEQWFAHAPAARVLDQAVRLCPLEEMIWSKGFVMERERFDGADILHLLRAHGAGLDWPRLLRRFGANWRVLAAHLMLFDYVYPCERQQIPQAVRQELLARFQAEMQSPAGADRLCRGTLLSRAQYLTDLAHWGYRDARVGEGGPMTREDVDAWTASIGTE